jgi:hypothetical protein
MRVFYPFYGPRLFCPIFGLMGLLLGSGAALAQNSVLAEGNWHRVAVRADGVYRLDRPFLEEHGIITAADSLDRVHVFGNGGGMLPQANDAPVADGLRALPVWLSDDDDFLLFYGQGPDRTYYDEQQAGYRVEKHLYDTANYYFITRREQPAAAMITLPDFTYGTGVPITERLAVYHHERDLSNLLGSGRQWLGEALTGNDAKLDVTFPGAAAGAGTLEVSVSSRATSRSTFEVAIDGEPREPIRVDAAHKGLYGYQARAARAVFALSALSAHPTVSLRYQDRTDKTGYLDYLTLNVREPLTYRQRPLWFSDPHARRGTLHRYTVTQARTGLLWDVTDPQSVAQQAYREQDSTITFQARADTLRSYLLFDPTDELPAPQYVGPVSNQNLRALPTPELLVIAPPALRAEAERLAQFRRQHDSLRVAVVTLPEIYNEFSAGRQDVTAIRNFIRHLYQRDAGLRYVLLFGDASYHYHQREAATVPTYQSRQSFHNVYSYASDDFFGFMDAAEGDWPEQGNGINGHALDIGIGRLPVSSPEEARTVVDKLIHYATAPETQGAWRQEVLFVADDGDANKHQHQSDFLASWLEQQQPRLAVQRLFMDAYPQPDDEAPAVREQLNRAVERGVGLIDFIGHGGETAWTNEQILDLEMIEDWRNYDRLPVLVTATCEFGRFDDPRRASGAEAALLSTDGGAIAVFTTSRPVFTTTNFQTSTAFYETAFGDPAADLRLGDIIRTTKNRSVAGTLNRNFVLLGDPSMRYAVPAPGVTVTTLTANGQVADTLRPLDRVGLQGQILDDAGAPDATFSGTVFVDLLAAPQETTTLGQEDGGRVMTFRNRDFRLFRGQATVRDGQFTLEFTLPKNTKPTFGAGKFTFYARHKSQNREASGARTVTVGGEATTPETDNTPPAVELFFNREVRPVPGTLHPHPTLIVHLQDEHGINLADETHGLRLVLDEWQEFSLNDDYQAVVDEPGRGRATFRLPDLVAGSHTLRVLASDTYLNTTERALTFRIVGDSVLLLQDVVVYPNPTEGAINVSFTLGERVALGQAELEVFTPQGRSVYRRPIELIPGQASYQVSDELPRSGATALPGLYLYRLTVHDQRGARQQHRGKLLLQR